MPFPLSGDRRQMCQHRRQVRPDSGLAGVLGDAHALQAAGACLMMPAEVQLAARQCQQSVRQDTDRSLGTALLLDGEGAAQGALVIAQEGGQARRPHGGPKRALRFLLVFLLVELTHGGRPLRHVRRGQMGRRPCAPCHGKCPGLVGRLLGRRRITGDPGRPRGLDQHAPGGVGGHLNERPRGVGQDRVRPVQVSLKVGDHGPDLGHAAQRDRFGEMEARPFRQRTRVPHLPGLQGRPRRRRQSAAPVSGVGAEGGGALVGPGQRGVAAAFLRPLGASLQRCGDVLVGLGRRRGQVPGRAIVMQARGERGVRRFAARPGRCGRRRSGAVGGGRPAGPRAGGRSCGARPAQGRRRSHRGGPPP